ncbi:N-acyl homoserine lactonase family protein [Sphingomonas lutea]
MIARMLVALGALTSASCATVPRSRAPEMALWRLDCGHFDIDDLEGRGRVLMPVSCYLIRHGSDYVLLDTGLKAGLVGTSERQTGQTLTLNRTIADQLGQIGVDPARIGTLVVSHFHGDHHEQSGTVSNARLLIGAGDLAVFRSAPPRERELNPWLNGKRPVEAVTADRDLFGDGRVRILFTPGHTPGHLAMLVKLDGLSVILTGDLVHNRDQLASATPSGNHTDKVRGKAEIERVLAIARTEKAEIIVGHDQRDIARLPAFPAAAE